VARTFRLRTLLLAVGIGLVVVWAATFWDAIPGTLHFTYEPHRGGLAILGRVRGTGYARYPYNSGPLMIKEWYFRGTLRETTWYRPDGAVVAHSSYAPGQPSFWYALRQDGSIRRRYPLIGETASGPPTFFDKDGHEVAADSE